MSNVNSLLLRCERSLIRLIALVGQKKQVALLTCGLVAICVAATASFFRTPVPSVHDEFSYLLAADTFARGRLVNPPHPMWRHLESFHILQQPVYASKYPPAQGLCLALGIVLGGHAIVGAWLGVGLSAAAMCWMLQGWISGRWALLGGLIVAFHPGIQLGWGQSYWGGCVALAGGALVFGAVPRLARKPRSIDALWMSLGLVVLANSRPYEGLIAAVIAAVGLIGWIVHRRETTVRTLLLNVAAPSLFVLVPAGVAMGYYNLRVTGDPLKMPTVAHYQTYEVSPLLLWGHIGQDRVYRHTTLQDFYCGDAIDAFHRHGTLTGAVGYKGSLLAGLMWKFYLGISLTLPLVTLRQLLRHEWSWYPLVGFALFLFAAASTVPWALSHYYAPGLPLLFLVIVHALRRLRRWPNYRQPFGRAVFAAVLLLHLAVFGRSFAAYISQPTDQWMWQRAEILSRLQALPGDDLVVVQYGPNHSPHAEWVYNEADIDAAKVVWARDMGQEKNEQLFEYFKHRRKWILMADSDPPRLLRKPSGK